jgi:hypothetical protein
MSQSGALSLVEATTNVVVGYGLAVLTQFAVFPAVGITLPLQEQLGIGLSFSGVSLLRAFALRRVFEAIGGIAASRERAR